MRISGKVLIQKMLEFIDECDEDELARIAEQMFGGACFPDLDKGEGYVFTPNENYTGVFGLDRLFVAVWSTGIGYADKTVEVDGDYKRLGFLPYHTLKLQIYDGCPDDLKEQIELDAQAIINKRGEQFAISASGQYVTLGEE